MTFFEKGLGTLELADLPWRKTKDPYCIWVSEIFLQQTQVSRVIFYYERFLARFPTVFALAESDWETFLPFFRGLGFYSRGKNMLSAAQQIVKQHNGIFPRDMVALQKLPGIGKYTAAAILSFAFDEPIPALDTNLNRVFLRFFGIPSASISQKAEAIFSTSQHPSLLNHALMDLGREICPSKMPRCEICPLSEKCDFLNSGKKEAFVSALKNGRIGKVSLKKNLIEVGVACIRKDGKYLIGKCGARKGQKWEFVGGKREPGEDWRAAVKREVWEEIGVEVSVRPHFFENISGGKRLRFFRCQILRGEPVATEHSELRWVSAEEFSEYDFPKTNHAALERLKKMRS